MLDKLPILLVYLLVPLLLLILRHNRNAGSWMLLVPLFAVMGVICAFEAWFVLSDKVLRHVPGTLQVLVVGVAAALAWIRPGLGHWRRWCGGSLALAVASAVAWVCLVARSEDWMVAGLLLTALVLTIMLGAALLPPMLSRQGIFMRGASILVAALVGPVVAGTVMCVTILCGVPGGNLWQLAPVAMLLGGILDAICAATLLPFLILVRLSPNYRARVASPGKSTPPPPGEPAPAP